MDLTLKVKKLDPAAVLPTKAKDGDAGYDVVALNDGSWSDTYVEYRTGIAVELPPGYHLELFPRSSISKTHLVLCNSIGLVDNGYRGEILFRFRLVHNGQTPVCYKKGEKIGQLVIRKTLSAVVEEVTELSETQRGTGGFGSSGK